jgi:hypothetical protein
MANKTENFEDEIEITDGDSPWDIAKKLAVQCSKSGDEKVRLAAARVLMGLGKAPERDTAIDPMVSLILTFAGTICAMSGEGSPLDMVKKMARVCPGCPKMGFNQGFSIGGREGGGPDST